MPSHVRLEETGNPNGGENYVIDGGDNPNTTVQARGKHEGSSGWCTPWKIATILLAVTCFFLILAVAGVFDSGTGDDAASTEESGGSASTGEAESWLTGDKAPNMIFLLADDIGWADIGHNAGQWTTPTIDAIIEQGVEFSKFYTHSLCTPSRTAFLTGRFAWRLGVQYPEVIHGMMTAHVPLNEAIYSEVTRQQGYNNYYVGRWGVGYASWDFTPMSRGFDKFFGYFGPEGGYYNHSTNHFDEWMDVYDLWDNEEPYFAGNGSYSEDLFLDHALEYIDDAIAADKPFTLTYASQTAHAPIDDDLYGNPPETFPECEDIIPDGRPDLYPRVYYCNKVKYLDKIWGELVDYLHEKNLWENTLIFVTSDNGGLPYTEQELFTDWACNWPLRGAKVTHYEGGLHVWAGMSGGLVPADLQGTTHEGLTHITDLAATAMRLSMSDRTFASLKDFNVCSNTGGRGLALNCKTVDGKNLFAMEEHDLIIHQVFPQYIPDWLHAINMDYAATDGEWKYMKGLSDGAVQGTGWYKFPGEGIITRETDPDVYKKAGGNCTHGCIFYLPEDPSELNDLSSKYPEIQQYFNDLIQAIWRGGFDEDYHPGQNYDEDYRGWNADNILRPYLSTESQRSYEARSKATKPTEFNYNDATPSWIIEPNHTLPYTYIGQTAWDPFTFRTDPDGAPDGTDSHDGLAPPTSGFPG